MKHKLDDPQARSAWTKKEKKRVHRNFKVFARAEKRHWRPVVRVAKARGAGELPARAGSARRVCLNNAQCVCLCVREREFHANFRVSAFRSRATLCAAASDWQVRFFFVRP